MDASQKSYLIYLGRLDSRVEAIFAKNKAKRRTVKKSKKDK